MNSPDRSSLVMRLAEYLPRAPYFAMSLDLRGVGVRHRLDHVEILILTGGRGRLTTYPPHGEPRVHRLRPGVMTMFRPGDQFRYSTSDPRGMSVIFVSFPDSDWRAFAGFLGIDTMWATAPEPIMVPFDATDEAVRRPFQLVIERFHDDPTLMDLVQFWLGIIPVLFPETARARQIPGTPPIWLLRSLEAMREEENLRRGLPRLLELAHVSSSHLAANTRRYLETTPTSLIMDIRLRHAAMLLTGTGDSIRAIALRCGFDNMTYFSTAFRRAHHVSPREYRWRCGGGPVDAAT